ncbi:hypothetical protein [Sphingomonas sp. 3-13AW]|uniref:hypothetical protein n=1 Tax=Sphingomonas sp. 3-13AW TaxID=3050450 RepID=UPI003BB49D27
MKLATRMMLLASAITLGGCMNSEGNSSPTPTATATPTPTPTPSPTPTPTPSPTPTAPAGVAILTESTSPLIGTLEYRGGAGQTARWATDYDGRFPPTNGWLAPDSILSPGFTPDYARAGYALSAIGIERDTRLLLSSTAPAGATLVSPLTGLIDQVGSQQATRAALQLNNAPFAVSATADLLTTSGRGAGAGPILAANVRTVLLWRMVDASMVDPGASPQAYTPFNLVNRNEAIAALIRAHPGVALYTEAGAEQLLRATGVRGIDDATVRAMAHLVAIYAQATTAISTDPAQATRYMLGITGFLDEQIRLLRVNQGDPSFAARAQALTVAYVVSCVLGLEMPAFEAGGRFFAGPDFAFLAPGESGSRPNFDQGRLGGGTRPTYGWAENDFTFNPKTLVFDNDHCVATIVSVSVPSQFAGKITASAKGPTELAYAALPGFRGIAHFDYVVKDDLGHFTTARFFVIVP